MLTIRHLIQVKLLLSIHWCTEWQCHFFQFCGVSDLNPIYNLTNSANQVADTVAEHFLLLRCNQEVVPFFCCGKTSWHSLVIIWSIENELGKLYCMICKPTTWQSCNGSTRAAIREYRRRFTTRRVPCRTVVSNVHPCLRKAGNFLQLLLNVQFNRNLFKKEQSLIWQTINLLLVSEE